MLLRCTYGLPLVARTLSCRRCCDEASGNRHKKACVRLDGPDEVTFPSPCLLPSKSDPSQIKSHQASPSEEAVADLGRRRGAQLALFGVAAASLGAHLVLLLYQLDKATFALAQLQ